MIFFRSFVCIYLSVVFLCISGCQSPLKVNSQKKTLLMESSKVSKFQKKNFRSVSQASQFEIQQGDQITVPITDDDEPKAKGLILAFKSWPPEQKQQTIILNKLSKTGLKSKLEIEQFKNWIFEWPEEHSVIEAEKLCKELSELPFLEYCEPDELLVPR